MVKRWDEQSGAYMEPVNVPMRHDEEADAWVETTGMAYDQTEQAWSEVWGQKVKAYVYGAVLETVTIKKDGIVIATVATNAEGASDEQIELVYGTYTLTGSVSGWTEEQTIGKDTTKFRVMPEGALYWYGNECTDVTGGWNLTTENSAIKNTNNMYYKRNTGNVNTSMFVKTANNIDFNNYHTLFAILKGESITLTTGKEAISYAILEIDNLQATVPNDGIKKETSVTISGYDNQKIYVGAGRYKDDEVTACTAYALWLE